MTKGQEDRSPQHKKPGFIQSKLTYAFFAPKHGSSSTTSPYFAKPAADLDPQDEGMTSDTEETGTAGATKGVSNINLYTERRSNLNRPPPTLKSSPSSRRSVMLAHVAAETNAVLPKVLKFIPNAPPKANSTIQATSSA